MDLNVLRNFISVVAAGNITTASEVIHVAQPTLSKQLRHLETYYGAKLILTERGSRRIVLTEAGRLLYEKAKYICSLNDSTMEDIRRYKRGAKGTLHLSVASSRCRPLVERMLREFVKVYPDISFALHESSSVEQGKQLLNGIGEIGLLSTPPDRNSDFEELFRTNEYFAAVFNRQSKWLKEHRKKSICLNQLKDIPLSVSAGYYEKFKQCCDKAGFVPSVKCVSTTRNTALFWAVADTAVTIIPISKDEKLEENLVVKKITDAEAAIYKSVVKVKGRPLSLLAFKFVEFYSRYGYGKQLCNLDDLYKESSKDDLLPLIRSLPDSGSST